MTEKEIKEKARELKNAYQREWRAKNRDKVRQSNTRYWMKKAAAECLEDLADEQSVK